MFSPWAIKPRSTIGWSWTEPVNNYGYACYLLEDIENVINPIKKPENYSIEKLVGGENEETEKLSEQPDIILILNESFYDLSLYTGVNEDSEAVQGFYQIENAVYGHAVTPLIGGGTNNSEYELLTSNSMYLLKADAPFNYLDLKENKSSLVAMLNSLGYETCGMHCAVPTNYSRNTAYKDLGMKHVVLGKEEFQTLSYHGKRPWLDADNYKDMIGMYEGLGDSPRFMYLLTYQNHGGYEQNEEKFDKICTQGQYGDLTDDINEYMTSVHMSAEAIKQLVQYFENSERSVIVCMVGDHAPAFISNLSGKEGMSDNQKKMISRSVPYMIWTNFDSDFEFYNEYVSMVDLGPILMKIATLPMTDYYQKIFELHEKVPVRTSDGLYMTSDGKIENLQKDSKYYKEIMQYYFGEYNVLSGGKQYQKQYFELSPN